MRFFSRPNSFSVSSIATLLFSIAVSADLGTDEVTVCDKRFGKPLDISRCMAALSNLPDSTLPSIFTTRTHSDTNNYEQVPRRFVDAANHPACAITVDLEGHSQNDVFVLIPWIEVRAIARHIIDYCVGRSTRGGMSTFGLHHVFEAIISPTPYNPGPEPAVIVNPDGSIDSVAIPPGPTDGRINVPLYLTVTVSGPRARPPRNVAEFDILKTLLLYIRRQVDLATSPARQEALRRARITLSHGPIDRVVYHSDGRWWDIFSVRTVDFDPLNTKVTCAASLGKPSTANCESVLFELIGSGTVALDPASGPLIHVSGNCALGIESTSKQTTTWETIRGIASTLLATCIQNPISGVVGGFAVSHAITHALPKRQAEPASQAPNFTLSMYLQEPFSGLSSETCAWKVASSHTGDVRQCPAPTGPWRPPERRLGENGTSFAEWRQRNETTVKIGNWTETIEGNFTALEEAANSGKKRRRT